MHVLQFCQHINFVLFFSSLYIHAKYIFNVQLVVKVSVGVPEMKGSQPSKAQGVKSGLIHGSTLLDLLPVCTCSKIKVVLVFLP